MSDKQIWLNRALNVFTPSISILVSLNTSDLSKYVFGGGLRSPRQRKWISFQNHLSWPTRSWTKPAVNWSRFHFLINLSWLAWAQWPGRGLTWATPYPLGISLLTIGAWNMEHPWGCSRGGLVKPCSGRSDKVCLFMLSSTILGKLSRLFPLFSPGTRGHQAPQHYTLLPPSLRTPAFPSTCQIIACSDSNYIIVTS